MSTIDNLATLKKKGYRMVFKSRNGMKGRLHQENFQFVKETFIFPNSEIDEKRKQNTEWTHIFLLKTELCKIKGVLCTQYSVFSYIHRNIQILHT